MPKYCNDERKAKFKMYVTNLIGQSKKHGCILHDNIHFGENKEVITAALDWVKKIVTIPEVGQVYKGKVKTIVQFGAFVEILPNKDGLLHISEIEWGKVKEVGDVLKEGQEVEVKIIEIDSRSGKIKLSRKDLLPRPPRPEPQERRPEQNQNN